MTEEFISNISAQADGREQIYLQNELSDAEFAEMHEKHMTNAIQMNRLSDEIREINAQKRVLAKENQNLVNQVKLGYTEENIDAWYIDDQIEGMRKYYNPRGEKVQERKLKPSERTTQLTMNVSNI